MDAPAASPDASRTPLARLRRARDLLARHALLLPVLALALWLRTTSFAMEHLYGDEAEYAIVARYLSRDWDFLAYPAIEGFGPVPFVSQPPLVLYLMALSMRILGPTDFAAILPSILLGVATVAVVYALGNRLGGRLAGTGAAALLAVLPFHVEMSRRAMLDAGYVLFLLLTVHFLVAWIQSREAGDARRARRHALGAGAAGAATALSKLPGVLAVPILLVAFLLVAAAMAARAARGRLARGEAQELAVQAAWGAAPVAAGGLLYFGLLAHLQAITNLWIKLLWQWGRVDADPAGASDPAMRASDWTYYFTASYHSFPALFGKTVLVLALVGLVACLVRAAVAPRHRLAHVVPVAATGILLAFFLWSDRKVGFYLLPFAPLAALYVGLAASGLRDLLRWGGIRLGEGAARHAAPFAVAAGLLVVAVPAYSGASDSMEDFVSGESQEQYFGYGTREAAWWIHDRDPRAAQYGTLLGRFTLHWYNEQDTYHWYNDHTLVEQKVKDGELRYVVYDTYLDMPADREFMQMLISKYDGQAVQTFRAGWGEVTVFELRP